MPSDKSAFRLVRTLRRCLDLTQAKFAAKLGGTYPTVNRWEIGRAHISRLAMKQTADLLAGPGKESQRLRREHLGQEGFRVH